MSDDREEHLEMAQELDGMDRDVGSWAADFLQNILTCLRGGGTLSVERVKKLRELHGKYFGVGATSEPDEGDED